jgi:hypothetical protein
VARHGLSKCEAIFEQRHGDDANARITEMKAKLVHNPFAAHRSVASIELRLTGLIFNA